jgi:transcriptional regulator with XRE-family HTH domain
MPLTPMARPDGPRVREIRKGMGLTQEQMARRMRRSHATVMSIEAGRPVSKIVMRQAARLLKVTLSEITLPEAAEDEQPGKVAA